MLLCFFGETGHDTIKSLQNVSPERGGVRISFGIFNTADDVDQLVTLIAARVRNRTGSDSSSVQRN